MRRVLSFSMLMLLLFFTSVCLAADPLDQWHVRNSETFTHTTLYDVAYGNGAWVAVGASGTIVISPDAATWAAADSGTEEKLSGVAFGNGKFVVVGANGAILQSSDTSTWISSVSGTTQALEQVTFGGGLFVAAGAAGTLLASPNGTDWVAIQTGTTASFTGIVYGNRKFVAFCPMERAVWISRDGMTWRQRKVKVEDCIGESPRLDFAGGRFFMNNGTGYKGIGCYDTCCYPLHTSRDGVTWTSAGNSADDSFPVAYGRGMFVGRNFSSRDGISWVDDDFFGGSRIFRIKYSTEARKFVAVGTEIFDSRDGLHWKHRTNKNLYGVAFGKNRFVAVGAVGAIRVSRDGKTWVERQSGTKHTLIQVVYAGGIFVAVGSSGTILTSHNGNTWTPQISGTTESLYAITYGKGLFVAVGSDRIILTSPDGISWTRRYYDPDSLVGGILGYVAFGNKRFIATNGFVATDVSERTYLNSSDGILWNEEGSEPHAPRYWGIAFANGRFLRTLFDTSGEVLLVMSSIDGSDWVQVGELPKSNAWIIGTAGGVFFMMNNYDNNIYSVIITSKDGSTWTTRETGVPEGTSANAVAFGAGTYVLVCDKGVILQSDPVVPSP